MPATEPSHTASRDPRKEELASLFRQWDGAGAGRPRRLRSLGIRLRLGLTVVLALVAAWVMTATFPSAAFWMEPSVPRALGNVRDQWVAGAQGISGPSNGYVSAEGLVPTRLVAVATSPAPAPGEVAYLFFCPLNRVLVLTSQALRIDPTQADKAAPRLARLVSERLALPEETAVSVAVVGRLLRGDAAPAAIAPFVRSFAQRVERAPADLWVIIDGARPSDERWAAFVWALAGVSPLLSLVFLVRSIRKQKRAYGVVS